MRSQPRPAPAPPRAPTLRWLAGGYIAAVLPHATYLPAWTVACAVLFALWRLWGIRSPRVLPGRAGRVALAALTVALVALQFGHLLGRSPGVALMVSMLGLKLLETERPRDVHVTVYLCYFLIATQFLHSQAPLFAVYTVIPVWLLTAALVDLQHPAAALPAARLRLAGSMLLQAVPIAAVLFVLFPRVQGPLWGLPGDAYNASSGLSDIMRPGNISELTLSDAVAFRVTFAGPVPSPTDFYWRGPVLWYTDGATWSAGPAPVWAPPGKFQSAAPAVHYTVTLEPHQQRWLFALDLPGAPPAMARMTPDFQVVADQPVHERIRYSLRSYPDYRTGALDTAERARALQLPPHINPRARLLAREWRTRAAGHADIVASALGYLRREPFSYTLTPPLVPAGEFVDTFLFRTREGFCEHYAASFTFLMRAAGVPARVVTGYQGGELNAFGRYWTVRQQDAHAWAEVWLEERGWTRVDPTAAVAPERVRMGLRNARLNAGERILFETDGGTLWYALRTHTRDGWDALNNGWNQWILGYGPGNQRELFSRFGLDTHNSWVYAGALLAALTPLLLALGWWSGRQSEAKDPVAIAYARYCAKLARRDLAPRAHEGASDHALRAAAARPQIAPAVMDLNARYQALRYGREPTPEALREFIRRVRAFRP